MKYTISQSPAAEADVIEAALWYSLRREGLDVEFFYCVDAVVNAIERSPLQFPNVHKDIRRALVNRFPYGVYFTINNTDIIIHTVMHLSRNPRKWKKNYK
jgi:toxin ParE1/3/4